MIQHYYRARSGSPAPPAGARWAGYVINSSSPTDETVTSTLVGDNPDILTLTVASYTTNNANSVFKVNGTTHVLGDTITVPLVSGSATIVVYFKGGNSSGNVIFVTLQITAATGTNGIGSPATQGYSKIV
jgi:hypothetical protein